MKHTKKLAAAVLLSLSSFQIQADAFSTCPSKAFLFQDSVVQLYGVNLATASTQLFSSNLGTNGKVNGVGFNNFDRYIYGWSSEYSSVVQIGDDYQVTPLNISAHPDVINGINPANNSNLPSTFFYVGDVSLVENTYFLYRKGYGLFQIDLSGVDTENGDDDIQMQQVSTDANLGLKIFDIAFHPTENFAYSVDRNGNLRKIDVSNGTQENLGSVGVDGTFGAVYFDVNEFLYISRNQDGKIFRIAVDDASPTAEFFAQGPSSGYNDGARCAEASIIDESEDPTQDYGDAPDTYGTSLISNGARHTNTGSIYLGASVDLEHDAKLDPNSDSNDDGINFITTFEVGLDSLIQATVVGSGNLNIWVDYNQDGDFEDAGEQIVTEQALTTGTHTLLVTTPGSASDGNTWARARYTSEAGAATTGSHNDGEVEDYVVTVINSSNTSIQNTPYFVAYEDRWPLQGDYDFNDVIFTLDSSVVIDTSNVVKQLKITGDLKAMGASYRNGFAIQLEGIVDSDIDLNTSSFTINGETQDITGNNLLEAGQTNTVLMISKNLWDGQESGGCSFYKTEQGCTSGTDFEFTVKLQFNSSINLSSFPQAPYKPFIFATEDADIDNILSVNTLTRAGFATNPGRDLEIHLKNRTPTDLADTSIYGMEDDASTVGGNTYQTSTGLPWAMAIAADSQENWLHPREYVDILKAYPQFEDYILSEGANNQTWFKQENSDSTKTYHY